MDLLVRAFRDSKLDAELRVAGSGPDRGLLESLAGGDKRIKFLGLVPEDDLCDFYNGLDMFVFPTAIEGYGLPPVEAMACRKPVVVLDDAVLPQEVRKHCLSVENLAELFDNINNIQHIIRLTDYDRSLRFAGLHSWKECVGQYIGLYNDIIKEGK